MGMMAPRRFITPWTYSGVFGRAVTVSQPLISWTLRMSTPYSASARTKVRYWRVSPVTVGAVSVPRVWAISIPILLRQRTAQSPCLVALLTCLHGTGPDGADQRYPE